MSMKFLVTLPRRSARLIWPAIALAAAMGATAAVAAPVQAGPPIGRVHSAPAKPVKFNWHPFKLTNGWKSATAKKLVTGTPGWALRDGVVYLRGAIKQPKANGSDMFGALPKYARPASDLYIQVFSKSDAAGILYIGSDGAIEAYGGNSYAFTSLAAVSYPTASIKSHQLKLLNGWQSSQPAYDTGNPAYAISHGVVYLSGSLNTAGSSPFAFMLPKAARPTHVLFIPVYTFDGTDSGVIEILPQGEVDIAGANAPRYTSLATVSFPVAATKWHKFKLEAGWKPFTKFGSVAPDYAVVNGVVYLDGEMKHSAGGTALWTNLPAAARTTDVADREVMTTSASVGAVTLTSSLALVSSMPFTNAEEMTSLAGVAYPPSS
jgi:hypothetical protein